MTAQEKYLEERVWKTSHSLRDLIPFAYLKLLITHKMSQA